MFGAVNSYGGRPTQTQLDRLKKVEKELVSANASFQAIISKDLKSLNDKLGRKKLDPIEIFDKREIRRSAELGGLRASVN